MLLRFSALIPVVIRALKRNYVPNSSINYIASNLSYYLTAYTINLIRRRHNSHRPFLQIKLHFIHHISPIFRHRNNTLQSQSRNYRWPQSHFCLTSHRVLHAKSSQGDTTPGCLAAGTVPSPRITGCPLAL